MRIMAIGDSITYGVIDSNNQQSGGYRIILDQELAAAGISADFVGTQASGPSSDNQHEGYPGYTLDQLATKEHAVVPGDAPDVMLVMGGQNDSSTDTAAMMIDDMSRMLDLLRLDAPNAVILVAQALYPQPDNTVNQSTGVLHEFNAALPSLIAQKVAAGMKVKLVDTSSMTLDDMSPVGADKGVHPSAEGYQKLAGIWANAIENMGTVNGTSPPTPAGSGNPVIAVDDRWSTATDTKLYFNTRYAIQNDKGADGGLVLASIAATSANGFSVTHTSDGTTIYSPTGGWTGIDRIDYTVKDANGSVDTGSVFVTVGTPPTITTNSGNALTYSYAENTAAGTTIVDLAANSQHTQTWSIASGNSQGLFSINSSTGVLSWAASPDYDTLKPAGHETQVLSVAVKDGGLSDTIQVTVHVTDVNDGGSSPPPADGTTGTSGADTLNGGDGDETFRGLAGDDTANGNGGNDTFVATIETGGDGNDTYNGGSGADTYDMSAMTSRVVANLSDGTASGTQIGSDHLNSIEHLIGGSGGDILTGTGGNDILDGGAGNDTLNANSGNDQVSGGDGDDMLNTGGGNDVLSGGNGNDKLDAGSGVDQMTGGAGSDTFIFRHIGDTATTAATTGNTASTRDVINDFLPGTDKIDLSQIDANRTSSSDHTDNAFVFQGQGAANLTTPGEIHYHTETVNGATHTIVEGTYDTTSGVDFQIDLVGNLTLHQSDFIL